jgi:hypothetical protein
MRSHRHSTGGSVRIAKDVWSADDNTTRIEPETLWIRVRS